MQISRTFKIIYLHFFIILFFYACSSSSVMVPVTRPAEINLKNFDKIAIGELQGKGSRQLTDELTIALFESNRFEVLDRQHMDKILAEHALTLSGFVDKSSAAEVGELVGAAALIFGNVSEYDYKEDLSHEDVVNKKSGKTTVKWQRTGTATVIATLRVVDLQTGKIIAISKLDKTSSTALRRDNKRPGEINRKVLFNQCRNHIVKSFMQKIAPYTENVAVPFATDDKMPELEQGYNLAKMGNWDAAISKFEFAIQKYKNGRNEVDKAYSNLGLGNM
ncbi:MAG: hypothetical protein DWQ10_18315, partial [Calditrichaeota bacterium]